MPWVHWDGSQLRGRRTKGERSSHMGRERGVYNDAASAQDFKQLAKLLAQRLLLRPRFRRWFDETSAQQANHPT